MYKDGALRISAGRELQRVAPATRSLQAGVGGCEQTPARYRVWGGQIGTGGQGCGGICR